MRRQVLVVVLMVSVAVGAATRVWASPGRSGSRPAQGYLGVDVRDLSDEELSALKIKDARGAEITRLDHDGPACKAGVRAHDVLLQMDGRVVDGQDQFRRMLHETPAGRTVTLVVLRDGQQQTLKATLGNREEVERLAWEQHITVVDPDGAATPAPPPAHETHGRSGLGFLHGSTAVEPGGSKSRGFLGTMLGGPYIGAVMEPVGPQLGQFFGVPSGVGLLVKSVEENSPAAAAGMRAGDVVIKANQMMMSTESDWTKSVHESKGREMSVLVLREKREQTLTLTPDAKRRASVQMPDDERSAEEARLAGMDLL